MEIKKVNVNKTDFQSEDELKIYLRDFVLDYTSQMNIIENDIIKKAKAEPKTDFFPELRQRYLPVFEAFCSDKKRSYGGRANSYGSPTNFDGIENFVKYSVELKNKNRAEIYFETRSSFDTEYLFVLVRKNSVWRIDNYKCRWFKNEKWKSGIL